MTSRKSNPERPAALLVVDQLTPVEFRADLVLELRDEKDAIVLSIVLESQRDINARKKFSWPVYVTVSRAERESETVLLVIAVGAEVAAWAAEPIDLGLSLGSIQPLVLGPKTLPVVTDPTAAEKDVELAVLSAMAHGNGPQGLAVLQAAFGALGCLDREHAAVYFQIIWDMLREPMRRALEALVERQTEGKTTFPPFAQQLIERGKLEGLQQGKLEGLQQGTSSKGVARRCSGSLHGLGSRLRRTTTPAFTRAMTWPPSTDGSTTSSARRPPRIFSPNEGASSPPRWIPRSAMQQGT